MIIDWLAELVAGVWTRIDQWDEERARREYLERSLRREALRRALERDAASVPETGPSSATRLRRPDP